MHRILLVGLALLSLVPPALAQRPGGPDFEAIRQKTQADHQLMLKQLGIKALRPGVNGNDSKASNAANYDEAKANPHPTLPDPLKFKSGAQVGSPAEWAQRRKEIVEDFDREVYGRVPASTPSVKWEVTSTTEESRGDFPVIVRKLVGHVDNTSYPEVVVDIQMTLVLPQEVQKPSPVVMDFSFGAFPRRITTPGPIPAPEWQVDCIKRGWGYATLVPTSVQADFGAGLTEGIIGLMNKGQPRKPEDWGALRAWAWGASRALDYFETEPLIDAQKVSIGGHSRYGKAALVTLANDERFSTGFISSSGAAGAKLHRRNAGELVENVASSGEYHWMAGNYMKYAGPLTWDDLPVDSHELIALCAPRPVFISSGLNGDAWVDARGMFMAAAAAGPVYELLGQKSLGTTEFPEVETGLMNGTVAFRQHSGGHTPGPNWPVFLDFANRYWGSSR